MSAKKLHDWQRAGDFYRCSGCGSEALIAGRSVIEGSSWDGGIPRLGCEATDTVYPGAIHLIPAWWAGGRHVQCEVINVSHDHGHGPHAHVRPLTGNPHQRMVKLSVFGSP